MQRIAVLITVHNRKGKTLRCMDSLKETVTPYLGVLTLKVFLTDDGCTDGTAEALRNQNYPFELEILPGDGSLFWNGGMINSWKAAIAEGGWNGYLWLNDDAVVLSGFWQDLLDTDQYSSDTFGQRGVYVGTTQDAETGAFTYGGFVYTNKFTLKDKMLPPNGAIQRCEAGHGNITFVASEVVDKQGIFCEKYLHGGTDHDYTYLAHKAGFPVLVLPHYSAECDNDHSKDGGRKALFDLPLRERLQAMNSPRGLNLHNALLFSRRCFPWRYPIILATVYFKALFPKTYYRLYLRFRGVKPPEWSK